jgi:tetrahydromethanopterin S-methyltransferase subunit F
MNKLKQLFEINTMLLIGNVIAVTIGIVIGFLIATTL